MFRVLSNVTRRHGGDGGLLKQSNGSHRGTVGAGSDDGDALGGGSLGSIDHDELLHHPLVDVARDGLQDEHPAVRSQNK